MRTIFVIQINEILKHPGKTSIDLDNTSVEAQVTVSARRHPTQEQLQAAENLANRIERAMLAEINKVS